MRKLILAALAASAAATPAFAQDATFTGPRAEAIVGWDHVGDDSISNGSRDGVVYGGQLGYDYQAGKAVFGLEGEVTGSTTKDTANGVLVAGDRLRVSAGPRPLCRRPRRLRRRRARADLRQGRLHQCALQHRIHLHHQHIEDHDTVGGWRSARAPRSSSTTKSI
jgi:outer membrane immunogenic protein